MNIMFFLKPKVEVDYLFDDNTLKKGLEKMRLHNFTAIPVIDREGKYVGVVTQGDFLWKIAEIGNINSPLTEKITVKSLVKNERSHPLGTNASVDEVLKVAIDQNFVPVVDGRNMFIGIVTRRDILRYLNDINGQI